MSFRAFPNITIGDLWNRETAAILQWTRKGKLNCVKEVTLTANSATTTLTDELIGPDSAILLMPMHTDAAGALGGLYFSTPTAGSVTINHANTASTKKKFRFCVIG